MSQHLPKHHNPRTARAIANRVALLMAPKLKDCSARRFDTAIPHVPVWPIELFLVASGPIVPKILVIPSNTTIVFHLYYGLMFRDRLDFVTTEVYHFKPPLCFFLEQGAEVIADAAVEGFAKFDLAEFVARGTPDGILKYKTGRDFALTCLQLAGCALYVGRDEEGAGLLRDTIRYAEEDSRNRYARLAAEARSYLSRLEIDVEGIRKELAAQVDSSWAHFRIATR